MISLGESDTQADLSASVDWLALLNVILAGFLVGVFVHELVHVILVAHPIRLCIHLGGAVPTASVCCFSEEEAKGGRILSLEMVAFGAQFAFMLLWAFLFRHQYIKPR